MPIENTSGVITGALSGTESVSGSLSQTQEVSGELTVPTVITIGLVPATTTTLGGIIVGDDLQITEDGVLSVLKATEVSEDNTHPITAAAVYTEVGNINALLATI